ncbi:UPF3 domain [Trinorchestia longiramus]|nr:UPF3 domain [Trinorchestia longiramus]
MKKDKVVPPPSKVVIRHLPSGLTEEEFFEVVNPLPEHNWFSFHKANTDYGSLGFCRAYINFCNTADIYAFRDQFDGYVFVDGKGNESPAVVEYAPFQKLALRDASPKRLDPRLGTITTDPDYLQFVQALENPESASLPGTEKMLEDLEGPADENTKTPLVEYIEQRRVELLRKLQNRSQFDKLNTRQLERVLKKEERKEHLRLRRAEKRRLRHGERTARKFTKQAGEDDMDDDYDEYEDIPLPASKVKGLSPKTERGSSTRLSDTPAKIRARRERKTSKKSLPEKDKHRKPEADTRPRGKDVRANEFSPVLDSKKVIVIKRRGDNAEPSADSSCLKSSQHPSHEQPESLSSPSKDNEDMNSTEELHQSVLDEGRNSRGLRASSRSKNGDESVAAVTAKIMSDDKTSSDGDATLGADGRNSSSHSSLTNDEAPPAEVSCIIQHKFSDNGDKSSFKDSKLINTNTELSDKNKSICHHITDDNDNDALSSVDVTSSQNQNDACKEVVSPNNASKASESVEHSNKKDKLSDVIGFVNRPCGSVGDTHSSSTDAALSISTDATRSTSTDPAVSTSTDPAVSTSTDPAVSTSTDPAVSTSTDPALGTSTDPALGTSTDPALSTSTAPTLSTWMDPASSISADAALRTSADAALSDSADVAMGTSDEQPRNTESGDDSSKTGTDPRTVRKIRNKDRPAMQLYRPGQCRLSSARLKQDNGSATTKDASSSHSSTPSPVMSGVIHDLPQKSSKGTDDPQHKSSSTKGDRDSHQSVKESTERASRGKERLLRDAPSSTGGSGGGRGEQGHLKKKPAKTIEFTNQRHNRGGGGGGGRGSDRGRGRYGQSKPGGSFEDTRVGTKPTIESDVSTTSGGGEPGHAREGDAVAAAAGSSASATKSQGKRYSRMRPAEK